MTWVHSKLKGAEFKAELEAKGEAVCDLVKSTLQKIL